MFSAFDIIGKSRFFPRAMCVERGRNRELQHHSQQLESSVKFEKGLVVRRIYNLQPIPNTLQFLYLYVHAV